MAEKSLTHRQRLERCLAGERLERVPVALWRHFPADDQDPARLAAATVYFQRTYDFDLVKVTPASSFCVKDWGVDDEWRGVAEGTRDYTTFAIHEAEDWLRLPVLDPRRGRLEGQLRCLEMIVAEVGPDIPVLQTIFNPLSQAKNLVSRERLLVHLRRNPEAVHAGLKTITESTLRFLEAALRTGIAGIFFAVQHAQYGLLSEQEYVEFGRRYDLQVLAHLDKTWLNMLHLHGNDVMFDLIADYPIQVVNWHDQETPPDLAGGKARFPGVVCGGLRRETTMVLATPDQVVAEARQAMELTGKQRFILGTGCVVPVTAPHGNLLAARRCVDEPG
ncbi:MAG: uroporphyrinogen decarboxylase family protein [Anaerolineales bacterium]|nr:uroporphyrinogen decarboxylase family protein [Anaerolineales bacterium]